MFQWFSNCKSTHCVATATLTTFLSTGCGDDEALGSDEDPDEQGLAFRTIVHPSSPLRALDLAIVPVPCVDGTPPAPVETQYRHIPLDTTAPGTGLQIRHDAQTHSAIAQWFVTLPAGCYNVTAQPTSTPDTRCYADQSTGNRVSEGQQTIVDLAVHCLGHDPGVLDILLSLNHEPEFLQGPGADGQERVALWFSDATGVPRSPADLSCSDPLHACAIARDIDGDPLRFDWSVHNNEGVPVPTSMSSMVGPMSIAGPSGDDSGYFQQCVRVHDTQSGTHDLELVVFDLAGNRPVEEWLATREYPPGVEPPESRAEMSFSYDRSCSESVCGDGIVSGSEQCEPTQPGGDAECTDRCRFPVTSCEAPDEVLVDRRCIHLTALLGDIRASAEPSSGVAPFVTRLAPTLPVPAGTQVVWTIAGEEHFTQDLEVTIDEVGTTMVRMTLLHPSGKRMSDQIELRGLSEQLVASATIGPEGGTLDSGDEGMRFFGIKLIVPPGAVRAPVDFSVFEREAKSGSYDELSGIYEGSWRLEPSGLDFTNPLTLEIPMGVDAERWCDGLTPIEDGGPLDAVHISHAGNREFIEPVIDCESAVLRAQIGHFSRLLLRIKKFAACSFLGPHELCEIHDGHTFVGARKRKFKDVYDADSMFLGVSTRDEKATFDLSIGEILKDFENPPGDSNGLDSSTSLAAYLQLMHTTYRAWQILHKGRNIDRRLEAFDVLRNSLGTTESTESALKIANTIGSMILSGSSAAALAVYSGYAEGLVGALTLFGDTARRLQVQAYWDCMGYDTGFAHGLEWVSDHQGPHGELREANTTECPLDDHGWILAAKPTLGFHPPKDMERSRAFYRTLELIHKLEQMTSGEWESLHRLNLRLIAEALTKTSNGPVCGNGRLEDGESCDWGAPALACASKFTDDWTGLAPCTEGCSYRDVSGCHLRCEPQCEDKACGADDGCGRKCLGADALCDTPPGPVCNPDDLGGVIEFFAAGSRCAHGGCFYPHVETRCGPREICREAVCVPCPECSDDPSVPTVQARSTGDPHFRTWDGLAYDFQAVGEFVAVDSSQGFIVQTRQAQWRGRGNLAANIAVAAGFGGDRIGFYLGAASPVLVNGVAVRVDGDGLALPSGARLTRNGGRYRVHWPSGEAVEVRFRRDFIDLWVDLPTTTRSVRGLMGTRDGNPHNDLETRAGQVLAAPYSKNDLYREFGDSWRISDAESLFDYAAGKGTADYTNTKFPQVLLRADALSTTAHNPARAICINAGVSDEVALNDCILDVAAIGEGPGRVEIARAAAEASSEPASAQFVADGLFVNFEPSDDERWTPYRRWQILDSTNAPTNWSLGPFGSGERSSFRVAHLGSHSQVTLSFQLQIIGPWAGHAFSIESRHGGTVLDTSFANQGSGQHFPGQRDASILPPGTAAQQVDEIAVDGQNMRRSIYHVSRTFEHGASELELEFLAAELPAGAIWSIDNLTAQLHSGFVDEPWKARCSNEAAEINSAPCMIQYCSEDGYIESQFTPGAACPHPEACIGLGRCDETAHQAGQDPCVPVELDDGDPCTVGRCDPDVGIVQEPTPDASGCNQGNTVPAVPEAGLLVHLPIEGDTQDWASGLFDGELHGAAELTEDRHGRPEAAASISVGGTLTLDERIGAGARSIGLWVQPGGDLGATADCDGAAILIKQAGSIRVARRSDGRICVHASLPGGLSGVLVSAAPAPTGQWSHLLIVLDEGNEELAIYLDGVQDQRVAMEPIPRRAEARANTFVIAGGIMDSSSDQLLVDDLTVHDRVLDAMEIANLARPGARFQAKPIDTNAGAGPEQFKLHAVHAPGDIDGFTITELPKYGTVTIEGDQAIYTPDENYAGVDYFEYAAVSGDLQSVAGQATITVNSANWKQGYTLARGLRTRLHADINFVKPHYAWSPSGELYVAERGRNFGSDPNAGLYGPLQPSGTALSTKSSVPKLRTGHAACIAYARGYVYTCNDFSHNIYRTKVDDTAAGGSWSPRFPIGGDRDPSGATIAPPGFEGPNVKPGDLMISDRDYSAYSSNGIYAFSDSGSSKLLVGRTSALHIVLSIEAGTNAIYGMNAGNRPGLWRFDADGSSTRLGYRYPGNALAIDRETSTFVVNSGPELRAVREHDGYYRPLINGTFAYEFNSLRFSPSGTLYFWDSLTERIFELSGEFGSFGFMK